MNLPFTYEDGSLLLRLLIAHLLTDFVLQSDTGVRAKKDKGIRAAYLWFHVLLTMIVTWILVPQLAFWKQVLFIGATHLLIDSAKIYASSRYRGHNKDRHALRLFLADQFLHLLVIIIAWLWMTGGFAKLAAPGTGFQPGNPFWLRLLGYLVVIGPASYLVRMLTTRWAVDLDRTQDGLPDAGMWIGFLERVLILTFVYMGQFTAIGFLVTGKSLLRLIDRPEASRIPTGEHHPFSARKHTEYVLIGTFLSITAAIVTGLLVNWIITAW